MNDKFQTRTWTPTRDVQRLMAGFARAEQPTNLGRHTPACRPERRAPRDVVAEAAMADVGGQFVAVADRQIYFRRWRARGPRVVLIHGFGTANTSWSAVGPLLARAGYATYALDLAGFGLSSKAWEASYGHREQADLVATWMAQLGLDSATIVGHSMGGNVAAHLALRHPRRVARLVLEAPAILSGLVTTPRQLRPLVQLPALRQAARLAVRRIIERSDFSQFEASNPQVLRVLRTADWDLALVAMARDSWANRLTAEELRRITVPTLLLWGGDDRTIPVTDSVGLQALLPQARFVSMPGAGHMAHEEDPQGFVERVVAAMADQTPVRRCPNARSA